MFAVCEEVGVLKEKISDKSVINNVFVCDKKGPASMQCSTETS